MQGQAKLNHDISRESFSAAGGLLPGRRPRALRELVLAENGQSAYKIVLAEGASASTRHGAEELQTFLQEMTGAKLPIASDRQPQGPKEIILGHSAHLRKLGTAIDLASLGSEGYVIRTVGDSLVIAGGQLRGNMYGVYGFLEDHLGCRWFAPGVSRIPKSPRLAVGPIDDRQVPALEFREPYLVDCLDGDWCARNRMNSSAARLEAKHGGKVKVWSLCHTFEQLMPAAEYYDVHPEYYSLVKGQRQRTHPQLCCTNPDVIRICTEAVRKVMRATPGRHCILGLAERLGQSLRVSELPGAGQTGRLADGTGAATRESRGGGRRAGVSRQDRARRWPTSGLGIRPGTSALGRTW